MREKSVQSCRLTSCHYVLPPPGAETHAESLGLLLLLPIQSFQLLLLYFPLLLQIFVGQPQGRSTRWRRRRSMNKQAKQEHLKQKKKLEREEEMLTWTPQFYHSSWWKLRPPPVPWACPQLEPSSPFLRSSCCSPSERPGRLSSRPATATQAANATCEPVCAFCLSLSTYSHHLGWWARTVFLVAAGFFFRREGTSGDDKKDNCNTSCRSKTWTVKTH